MGLSCFDNCCVSPYSSVLSTGRAIADNCVPGLEPGDRPVNVGRNVLGFKN